MYDEPEAVNELMFKISEAFSLFVKKQREITNDEFGTSNGLQGVWSPNGGVWLSDDDLVSIGSELYEKFILPHYSRIFTEFGGGHLHYCGDGSHQLNNILSIKGLTAINNSPMSNFDSFHKLQIGTGNKYVIEIQDAAPEFPELYYNDLFDGIKNFNGIMVVTFVEDELAMDMEGRTVFVKRDPYVTANEIVKSVRKAVSKQINK